MSKIFDLINELCPQGVEFIEIEEVFIMKNGYTPSKANKKFWENGTIPWFRMEDIRENGRILSESIQKITPQAVKGGKLIPKNSIIVATTATIGEHALAIADSFLMNQRFTSFTIRELLKDKLDVKFVFYYFFKICEWCKQNTNSSSFPSVDMAKLKKVKFPVPPMEVQREIVRILDSFTLLTAELITELTAELTARKKQYEFYRDFLLSFDELDKNGGGCELKMLGEICDLIAGGDISKDKVSKEKDIKFKFPIYSNGIGDNALYGFTDEPRVMKQCVTISARGTIGYCALRLDPFYPIVRLICAIPKSNITAQFLKYFLDTQKISVPTSGIPQLTIPMVAKIKIPVPSLQTQQKVVEILDKFDTLVNSITKGLPREIELRRKQYEHYRELLLNFKPKMTA
jgi:type I site-specific deoxyribonuclease